MATIPPDAHKAPDKFTQMTTAPVEGLIIKLAIPSIAIMLVSALYNMADTYFVGALGTSQVAAVGVAFPLMAVIQAIGFFFGQGSGNYLSRALGAKNTDGASRMAATGFFSGFLAMALIAAAGLMALRPLVVAIGATPTIVPYAEDYVFYILLASPWMVAATVLNQQLRFQGSASIAMIGMVSGAVLNVGLDPLFIFVFRMGVSGAAVATMVSQVISFAILLLYGTTRGENLRIRPRLFSPTFSRYAEMFRGGIPALLRQGLMSIAIVFINHLAGRYGDEAIAAISIVQRLSMLAISVILGFGQGYQPVCGFNYGARHYARVKRGFWFCIRIGVFGLLVTAILLAIYAPETIALFRRDDPEVIRIGALGLRLQCLSLPFVAVVILTNMLTQTIGQAFYASLMAVSRSGLFLLPAVFLLSQCFALGLLGIQWSLPVADFCSFLLAVPIIAKVLKGMK